MDRLWAPWRLTYVKKTNKEKKKGCLFCRKFKSKKDRTNYVIERRKHSFALLNIYPYNNGHLMIVPYRHIDSIEALEENERLEMMKLLSLMVVSLKKALNPDGFNVGMNLGDIAGAGIVGHLHLHIVPRWKGDCNFMPVLSETRVVPEALQQTYQKLKESLRVCLERRK